MSTQSSPTDDPFHTTRSAAQFLHSSVSTLERHRLAGTGPDFKKCGPGKRAKVLYRQSALVAWLDRFSFTSTSQYGR